MNVKTLSERRDLAKRIAFLQRENLEYGDKMERALLPPFPPVMEVWRSRNFLVQVLQKENGAQRISVNRTMIDDHGRWLAGIPWDDLQRIKNEIGFAGKWAVEIYPAEGQVVNVANMRHLWLLDEPPAFAWKSV